MCVFWPQQGSKPLRSLALVIARTDGAAIGYLVHLGGPISSLKGVLLGKIYLSPFWIYVDKELNGEYLNTTVGCQ